MPELNGIDAALQMRQVCPFTEVIILSMHADTRHIARALQAGAHGYLIKESAGREVVKAVREVNAGHRYLSQTVSDSVSRIGVHYSVWTRNTEMFSNRVNGRFIQSYRDLLLKITCRFLVLV